MSCPHPTSFGSTAENLRKAPLYLPYMQAIKHIAGYASTPFGALDCATILSKNMIFDAMADSPYCQKLLKKHDWMPVIGRPYAEKTHQDTRKLTVLGQVMADLGYTRFSKTAWSRPSVNSHQNTEQEGVTA